MGQSFPTWEYVIGFRPRCSQEASWYSVVLWAELQGLELRDLPSLLFLNVCQLPPGQWKVP